jgi:hypothetical protein
MALFTIPLYVTSSGKLRESDSFPSNYDSANNPLKLKFGDSVTFRIYFLDQNLNSYALDPGSTVEVACKPSGKFDYDGYLAYGFTSADPDPTGNYYEVEFSVDTLPLATLLNKDLDDTNDVASVLTMFEVSWTEGVNPNSTVDPVNLLIYNDVISGAGEYPSVGYANIVQATNIFTVFADADVGAMLLSFDRGGIYSPTGVFFSSTGTYDQDEAATALADSINSGDHGVTAVASGSQVTVTADALGPDGNGILCGISTGSEFGAWLYAETRGGTEGLVLRAIEQALTDEEKVTVRENIGLPLVVDEDGDIVVTMELADVSGTVPDAHVLSRRGAAIVIGDGFTDGGILVEGAHNELTIEVWANGVMKAYLIEGEIEGATFDIDAEGNYLSIGTAVTSLGDSFLLSNSLILRISIPKSVTSLGDYCFMQSALTQIKIPNSVTSIGQYCFSNCGIPTFTIPPSVTVIGEQAFADNAALTDIYCHVTETIFGAAGDQLTGSRVAGITIHARADDSSWDALVAASPTTYQGHLAVTVIKDL